MMRLALPVVVVQVGMMLLGVVDTMVVGHLSSQALAAVALGHVTIVTVSQLRARLHYLAERYIPSLRDESQPYHYSLSGIRNTLSRHFHIVEEHALPHAADLKQPGTEWMFICKRR